MKPNIKRLDLMTYEELIRYADWSIEELQKQRENFHNGDTFLWGLLSEISLELSKRTDDQ